MAIPSILLQLARNNPRMMQLKQMMNAVKMAQNPTAMLNQMAMNNPQLKQVMDIVGQYGGDVSKAVTDIAGQNGIDPNELINLLK